MSKNTFMKRDFAGKTVAGIATATLISNVANSSPLSAVFHKRICDTNDRINNYFLCCSGRRMGHLEKDENSEKDKKLAVVAICNIYSITCRTF